MQQQQQAGASCAEKAQPPPCHQIDAAIFPCVCTSTCVITCLCPQLERASDEPLCSEQVSTGPNEAVVKASTERSRRDHGRLLHQPGRAGLMLWTDCMPTASQRPWTSMAARSHCDSVPRSAAIVCICVALCVVNMTSLWRIRSNIGVRVALLAVGAYAGLVLLVNPLCLQHSRFPSAPGRRSYTTP